MDRFAFVRRLLASALAVLAVTPAGWEVLQMPSFPWMGWCALAAPLFAAAALHVRRLEAQALARSVLWAMLIAGTLFAWVVDLRGAEVHAVFLALTFGSGLALLAVGTQGLDAPGARVFAPVAFRGVLLAIIVMAFADTLSLIGWGGLLLENANDEPALWFFLGGGAVMLVAVYGLYRLRVWGFALNVAANVAIAAGAWLVPNIPAPIAICLTGTAVAQLLVGVPLIRGLARGEKVSVSPRFARGLGALIIVALLASVAIARVLVETCGLGDCL